MKNLTPYIIITILVLLLLKVFLTPPIVDERLKVLEVHDTILKVKYKEGKDRILKQTDTILERWDSIPLNLDSSDCNDKLGECIEDVKKQSENVKKAYLDCDSLILSKERIIDYQKSIRPSKFGVYTGVGMGVNSSGQFQPNVNISIGFKIK